MRADTELLDYDEIARLAEEHKPRMIVCGASAYPRIWDFARIAEIARSVGRYACWPILPMSPGRWPPACIPAPFPHADFVTTSTHKTLRGPRGGLIMCREQFAKDLDRAVFPGVQGGPLVHVIAAKAVCLQEALQPAFVEYQRQVLANAKVLAGRLLDEGFRLVSGGTDNHLMLVDVAARALPARRPSRRSKRRTSPSTKMSFPSTHKPLTVTSGIRIGTPAVTTRGMKEQGNEDHRPPDRPRAARARGRRRVRRAREEVLALTARFPL